MATRIETADGRALAVHVMQKGNPISLAASCEIILSAGAVNSPQILQLSGIGPGAVCQRYGIDRLRIVDASVFPNITSANLNAPTIKLAHNAAQLIPVTQTG